MPYNLSIDLPVNREVAERIRQMDEWIDMHPQYVATDISPDHFPNRMLVGGAFDDFYRDPRYLQSGSNNRNTPYHFYETMDTPSAGKFTLKKAVKAIGKVAKPVSKFAINEILVPVAKELKAEGVKVAKEMLKEAIKSALSGDASAVAEGAGRKPRDRGVRGGNVYPSASMVHGEAKSLRNNIPSVGGRPVRMDLPTDVRGGSSGGKFNLKKALKNTSKDVGKFIKEDYTPFMVNKVAPVAKEVAVRTGRVALPLAIEAIGAEFGVPPMVSGVIGSVIADKLLSEKMTGVKGGKRGCGRPKKSKCATPKAKKSGDRGAIVKRVMKEKGLSLPMASKYVKEHGLY